MNIGSFILTFECQEQAGKEWKGKFFLNFSWSPATSDVFNENNIELLNKAHFDFWIKLFIF